MSFIKRQSMPALSVWETSDQLIKMSKIRTYEAGEVICEEGLNDKWIFFLTKGRVRIVKEGRELSVLEKRGDIISRFQLL